MHVLIVGEWAVDDWRAAEFWEHVSEGWYAAAKVMPGELGVDPVSELFVGNGCMWWRVVIWRCFGLMCRPVPRYVVF